MVVTTLFAERSVVYVDRQMSEYDLGSVWRPARKAGQTIFCQLRQAINVDGIQVRMRISVRIERSEAESNPLAIGRNVRQQGLEIVGRQVSELDSIGAVGIDREKLKIATLGVTAHEHNLPG
jgi:hypothetical protein